MSNDAQTSSLEQKLVDYHLATLRTILENAAARRDLRLIDHAAEQCEALQVRADELGAALIDPQGML